MRRRLAAAALAAGMLAAAACGNDNDDTGGQSTEEVCATLNEQVPPLEADLNAGLLAVGSAAAQGDDAATTEAALELTATVEAINDIVRDGAENAEDEQFSAALNTLADELENLADGAASGEMPDMTAFEAARGEVEGYCGS